MQDVIKFWYKDIFSTLFSFQVLPNVTVLSLVMVTFVPIVVIALFKGVSK